MDFPSESRQLCHGLSFSQHEPTPVLRFRATTRWINEPMRVNRSIRLDVSELKFCLGYITMNEDGSRNTLPCPKNKPVRTGTQCESCGRMDQSKFMHHFHKTGEAPAGMRKYLEQPHFLYVASFAHGAIKVGTTSTQSKWSRLAQQGAVIATYIARTNDGVAIRVLEDLVTEHVGLRQQVRQKSKIAGLTSWELDYAGLQMRTAAAAKQARDFLAAQRGLETYGVQLLDEVWEQPDFARPVVEAWNSHSVHPWESSIPDSVLNIRIRGVLGQALLVDSGDGTTVRLLDVAQLKSREVTLGEQRGDFREEQSALF